MATGRPEGMNQRENGAKVWQSRCGFQRTRIQFTKPFLEKASLAIVGNEFEGAAVTPPGFFSGARSPEEVRAGGMEQVVVVEHMDQAVDELKPLARAMHHGDRHGAIQGNNG